MIIELLGWACVAHLYVDLISTLDKNDTLPQKPFKCDLCMGFYLSVLPLIYNYELYGILYAAIVGVTADIIYRIKNRI
jgi:hypothetical protein